MILQREIFEMNALTRINADRQAGDFVRIAKSIGQSNNNSEAARIAERSNASDRVIETLKNKAATPAASLADPAWAGALADTDGAAVSFIESLRPQSVFYRFIQFANTYPLFNRIVSTAAIPAATAAEMAWLPVVSGSFAPVALAVEKVGAIVVVSEELVNATDPASFSVLRRELQRGATAAVDDAFLGIALAGTTPTAAPDALAGIAAMLETVAVTGSERLIFVAGVKAANRLSTATVDGVRQFPAMGPAGGSIIGVETIVSDRIAPNTLALLDAASFAANEGSVDIDLARSATLQMRTDPETEETETVSMFQSNSVALRVVAVFGASRTRATAVAAISIGA